MRHHLFSHLDALDPAEFVDLDTASASEVLSGQATTASLLRSLGSPEDVLEEDQTQAVRAAFTAVTDINVDDDAKKKAVLTLRVPEAVKHLAGMLSEYDWDFVHQAREIRGYVVARLLDETKDPNANIRLKALKLLGDVTEVGAFTQRIEVKKTNESVDELEERIRAKLATFMPKVVEVQDATAKPPAQDGTQP